MTRFRLGVALAIWAAVVGALLGSDADPQIAVLGGLVFIIVTVGFITLDLLRAANPLVWARVPQPQIRVEDEEMMEMAQQLRDPRRSSQLRDTLLSLADERLLDHRGIDRSTHPAAANAALGPCLVALLEDRRVRLSDVTDLHTLLDEIESI